MAKREYDRSKWGPGPWDGEPDRLDFTHKGRACLLLRGPMGSWCGYASVEKGHPFYGRDYTMCIHPKHKAIPAKKAAQANRRRAVLAKSRSERDMWYRLAEAELRWRSLRTACGWRHSIESLLNAHGGITYSGECQGEICHPTEPGKDHVWWFGFDTAHLYDLVPEFHAMRQPGGILHHPGIVSSHSEDVYRTMEYVKEETIKLAEQLDGLEAKDEGR